MTYHEYKPDQRLLDFISCYWEFRNDASQPLAYTILPDGCFDLLISLENYSIKSLSLTGLWTKPIDVSLPPGTHLFAVRFKLPAAEYLLQQSIAALVDSEITPDPTFLPLHNTCFSESQQLTAQLNQIFLAKLSTAKRIDNRKLQLFKLLETTKGNLTVQAYSQAVLWTSRQINRYFSAKFGLSLKAYCTILKSHASYRHIKNGQLFPEQNYFDQSHFIKEIIKHTGHHPRELYQNKNDRFLQLVTMNEK